MRNPQVLFGSTFAMRLGIILADSTIHCTPQAVKTETGLSRDWDVDIELREGSFWLRGALGVSMLRIVVFGHKEYPTHICPNAFLGDVEG